MLATSGQSWDTLGAKKQAQLWLKVTYIIGYSGCSAATSLPERALTFPKALYGYSTVKLAGLHLAMGQAGGSLCLPGSAHYVGTPKHCMGLFRPNLPCRACDSVGDSVGMLGIGLLPLDECLTAEVNIGNCIVRSLRSQGSVEA